MTYFIPTSKIDRFRNAMNLIEEFLTTYKSEHKFKLEESTTNNFNEFKKEVEKLGYMKISKDGCNNTIYSHWKFNIIARLWHDDIHLKYDLNFSYDNEVKVAQYQIDHISRWLEKRGTCQSTVNDIKEMIYHDIITQAKYYKNTGKFVDDQFKFVYSHFLGKGGLSNECKNL